MANEIKYLSYDGLDYFWNQKLKPIIEENEEVVATALVNFDDRLNTHTHMYVASAGYSASAAQATYAASAGSSLYSASAGYSAYAASAGYSAYAARSVTAARAVYCATSGYAGKAAIANKVANKLTIADVSYDGSEAKRITIDTLGGAATNHTHSEYAPTSHTHNYLPLSGGKMSGGILPDTTDAYYLGNSSRKWYAAYATTFYGNLSGNATRASGINIQRVSSSVYYPMVFTNVISATNGASLYIGSSTGTAQASAGIRYNPSANACYCSGGFYEASDERLKNFGDDIEVDLDKLSQLSKKYFTWKDDKFDVQHIGISAQEIQKLYPELVSVVDEEGHLSVSYDKLSVIALKSIDVLNNEVKSLEERITKLEKLIYTK